MELIIWKIALSGGAWTMVLNFIFGSYLLHILLGKILSAYIIGAIKFSQHISIHVFVLAQLIQNMLIFDFNIMNNIPKA